MSEETKIPSSTEPEERAAAEGTPEASPEKAPPRRLSRGQQKRRERSVFQYITILFAAAFVLLLLTFMMEKRQYELLQQQNEEQIDDLQQSVSAVQSLDNLYKANESLRQEVDGLEESISTLEKELAAAQTQIKSLAKDKETLSRQSQSMDWFWQINEAYVRGKFTLCRSLIDSLVSAGLTEYLPKESITANDRFSPYDRYQEIYEAVN